MIDTELHKDRRTKWFLYGSHAWNNAYCIFQNNVKIKVFVKQYAPGDNKVQKTIFSFKVKFKVTRSLTLVSFERA